MIRNVIISLSILFFMLSGIIAFKAAGIPFNNTNDKKNPDKLDAKKILPGPENTLKQIAEERESHQALVKELRATIVKLENELSKRNRELQASIKKHNDPGVVDAQTANGPDEGLYLYSRPDDKSKLNENMNVNVPKASGTIYTIQTGSYAKKTDARKEYESVKERINGEDLDYLRIEKIGKYYAVRIGRFNDFEQSEKFLKSVKPQILSSVTLKAYIKVDRIVRLYK